MKEFKINQSITVKLEYISGKGKVTNIYVNKRLFRQCKHLLLQVPKNNLQTYNNFNSIDELADVADIDEGSKIPPEVEFWGHCSNLQAWVENNYDTRLLHSNLAFPLLKKLTEEGDLIAKKVFKEEIVRRIMSGSYSIITYLCSSGYIDYLTDEEKSLLFLDFKEKVISNLDERKIIDLNIFDSLEYFAENFNEEIIKDIIRHIYELGDIKYECIKDGVKYETVMQFILDVCLFNYFTTKELLNLIFNSKSPTTKKFRGILVSSGVSREKYRTMLERISNEDDERAHLLIEGIISCCRPFVNYSRYNLRWELIKMAHDCIRILRIEDKIQREKQKSTFA